MMFRIVELILREEFVLQGDTCMHLESCQGTVSVEPPRATAGYIMDIITVPLNKLETEINITRFITF